MRNALQQVRLDIITVKPYLTIKNILLFTIVPAFLIFTTQALELPVMMVFMFCSLYVTYPFAVGDKNGIDTLYCTLPLTRRAVVTGRYLFALCTNLVATLLALALAGAGRLILGASIQPMVFWGLLGGMWVWFTLSNSFTLPFYFKIGYTQAKFLTYIPYFIFPIVTIVTSRLLQSLLTQQELESLLVTTAAWLSQNVLLLLLAGAAIVVSLYFLSYKLSVRFYQKRSF